MRTYFYLNYTKPTGYWTIQYPVETLSVVNYTTRVVYIHIGRDSIPSLTDYDRVIPAGGMATYPVQGAIAFAAALDIGVLDSNYLDRGIPEQVEISFLSEGEVKDDTGGVLSSKTPLTPDDHRAIRLIPAGATVTLGTYQAKKGQTTRVASIGVSVDGTTMPNQLSLLVYVLRNNNTGLLIADIARITSLMGVESEMMIPYDFTMRYPDQIQYDAINLDRVDRNIRVSQLISVETSP